MKRQNIYKGFLDPQSEFDHRFCCWASNHNGWSKAKKANKRRAKRREKRAMMKEILSIMRESESYEQPV